MASNKNVSQEMKNLFEMARKKKKMFIQTLDIYIILKYFFLFATHSSEIFHTEEFARYDKHKFKIPVTSIKENEHFSFYL
jgi:hypothetical protein